MNSPFAWPGGKTALKTTLLKLIPEHDLYVEAFAGSAKLLFAKEPSRYEVMNDLNGEVTNFFRVCKHRTAELAELHERFSKRMEYVPSVPELSMKLANLEMRRLGWRLIRNSICQVFSISCENRYRSTQPSSSAWPLHARRRWRSDALVPAHSMH